MTSDALILLGSFLIVLLLLSYPLGSYMARIFKGENPGVLRFFAPLERGIYRLAGVDADKETGWKRYTIGLIMFSLVGTLFFYTLQRLQAMLPLNPQAIGAASPDLSFNTAVSFMTNTDWQAYSGETGLSYLSQMLGVTVLNFLSAASGIVVVLALIRGFARHSAALIGNIWVDLTRVTLYILLPLALLIALMFVSQGAIQNLQPNLSATTVQTTQYQVPRVDSAGNPVKNGKGVQIIDNLTTGVQVLPMGPVASQQAIAIVGTNGDGFFNANASHPYENPTPLSNFIHMLAIFLIPAGLCFTFGSMVGDKRQGWAVISAMTVLFVIITSVGFWAEQRGIPALTHLGVDQQVSNLQAGGNMEGKETRFGINSSMLFVAVTTSASCGAVNTMHDSLTPIGGLVPTFLIELGEVVFGGVGSGLYGMLIFAILAVFIAGLMVGRTPEYLGKKIEIFEMKMTALVILITPTLVLALTAIAVMMSAGRAGIANPGAHGFTEILYAFSSAANNNGSAFAGLSANTPYYNTMLAIGMWFGRFFMMIPILAIAGSVAGKKRLQVTSGTLPTHGPLFVVLLIGTVLLVGALNYVPALALGPVAEHLQMILAH
jgi:K+-transporting ATPase ATPase A chain